MTQHALLFFVASYQRALVALQRRRVQHACGVTLLLVAGIGCESALGLNDYHFGSAGTGSLGTDNTLDSNGGNAGSDTSSNAGSGGRSGNVGGGKGGSAGHAGDGQNIDAGALTDGGVPDSGVVSGLDAGVATCGASERCVPDIPDGWQGPLVIGNGVGSCPGEYSTPLPDLHSGFQAGAASCTPSCIVTDVQCALHLENEDALFAATQTCQHPPEADECLHAVPVATCSSNVLTQITPSSFTTTNKACGGALVAGACEGGACYPSGSSFGSLCISSSGDVQCPAEFPARVLRYAGLSDTRQCSTVTCNPRDQICRLDVVICDTGGDDSFTIGSTDATCLQLTTSSGDGVQPGPTPHIDDPGGCDTSGGTLVGTAEPINPVTLCCLQ